MRRILASSLLSLLILTTLVWGGCISCDQYFMLPGTRTCCAPGGHCKTTIPAQKDSGRDCKQIAFDYQKTVDLHVDLPIVTPVVFASPLHRAELFASWRGTDLKEPDPPDLQVLHSTFLL